MTKNARNVIKGVVSTLFGNVDVMYRFQECLDDKRKFQIQINGFSGNWSNISIKFQKGDIDWEHYTLTKKKS